MVSPIKSVANVMRVTNISLAPTPAVSAPRERGVAMLKKVEALRAIAQPTQTRFGVVPAVRPAGLLLKRGSLILGWACRVGLSLIRKQIVREVKDKPVQDNPRLEFQPWVGVLRRVLGLPRAIGGQVNSL